MSKSANRTLSSSPSALGYCMPAEWESHAATWIAWPHYRDDWPGKFEPIPWVYAEIVRHLVPGERVEIVATSSVERKARRILKEASVSLDRVRFHNWPTDRVWTRDSGPIFVVHKSRVTESSRSDSDSVHSGQKSQSARRKIGNDMHIVVFRFNAWAKYNNWRRDAQLAERVARQVKLPFWKTKAPIQGHELEVVLEGGSIDVDGEGTLLTTEECQLSRVQQRNPGITRAELERIFHDYLGVGKVIWLGRGIAGDDTHGHVDDIARFVAPRAVVAAAERDSSDVNYLPLRENLRRLRRARDAQGRRLQVFELPMPAPIFFKGRRLPASYSNFYIANKVVLVPVFNDPNDRVALNLLARLFPKRKVVGIYSGDLIWGLGAMHCLTQQQPR